MKDNWPITTSLFAFLLTILGFIYSWIYYDEFGINYLEHAGLSDLISVIFVHPQFLFGTFLLIAGLLFFMDFSILKKDENDKSFLGFIVTSLLFLLIVSIPYWVMQNKIGNIKKSISPIYKVHLTKEDFKINCATSIGSTISNIFYWDLSKKIAVIVPKSSIIKIDVVLGSPPRKRFKESPAARGQLSRFQKEVVKWNSMVDQECKLSS